MKGLSGLTGWAARTLAAVACVTWPARASIELVAPVDGEEIAVRTPSQSALLAIDARDRRKAKAREFKRSRTGEWRTSRPVVFKWRATDGETRPWRLCISTREDMSCAQEFDLDYCELFRYCEANGANGREYAFTNSFANLLLGRKYYWRVEGRRHDGKQSLVSKVGTFRTALDPPRWIRLEGRVRNVRDLGGWETVDGFRVRQGLVYRAQGLNDNSSNGEKPGRNRLTVEDAKYLGETLGIKTELDLRHVRETGGMKESPIGHGVKYVQSSSGHYAGIFRSEHKAAMRDNIKMFADMSNYPILFHCIEGADRTGTLAYMLLGLLGVDKATVEKEWEETFYPSLPTADRGRGGKRYWKGTAYFDEGLAAYGDEATPLKEKIERYLEDCGVAKAEMRKIREIMLEGNAAPRPAPRPALAKRLAAEEEIIALVHWGPDTYTDREWGYGDEDPAIVNPAKFDADQIVGACRAGGACGIVLVAKHHDGFCLWPTKTTEHNISKSPFRGGKGDYVKEIEQACRRAGLKFGVYVSPWDRNSADYGKEKYVEIYHAQLRELLDGGYGEIFEVWFDGANGGDGWYGGAKERRKIGDDYYRFNDVFRFVRETHPDAVIFCGEEAGGDLRWPGNERGMVKPDARATQSFDRRLGQGKVSIFKMMEADFPLRKGWIWHEKDRGRSKSAAYLMKIYLQTVGNGAVMNIGVAPDKDGLVDEEDSRSLAGFKAIKDAFFATEVADGGGEPFNVVVMREDVSEGEKVDGWEFKAGGKVLAKGRAIGNKRIRVLGKPAAAKNCEVAVTAFGGGGRPEVAFKLYRADEELVKTVLESSTTSGETDTAKWMKAGRQGRTPPAWNAPSSK